MFEATVGAIQKTMTPFDYFLLICLAGFGFRGFYRGIMKELFVFGGAIVGMLAGRTMGPSVGAMFMKSDPTHGAIAGALGFAIVFFMVMIASTALSFTTRKLIKITGFGMADRILGLILGLIIGLIIPGLFLYLIVFLKGSIKGSPVEASMFAEFNLSFMKLLSGLNIPIP